MKKILAIVMTLAMVFTAVTVLAEENAFSYRNGVTFGMNMDQVMATETGRYEFSVIKNCFSFRVANPYTRERKEAMRRYALENDTIAAVSGRKEKTNDRKEK